ncbi:hypothetical protein DIU31_013080 [Mucilaginibacter rubeus]|uniref:Uncharacterized protein n=1 Tax=Mucilaginibacter rubeus TaxID=2027860 RepID=A0AAE6JG47_9SPHI|nr:MULTISPECIES: hypothetical protein [Mucilaginibacter]QEM04395.1 hypothetical protein DIU31_013080 [Mucilaginibacter rubeus]QEM16993.1 hypothetical protein DIU38_013210 [Mucilaginibacter gossypii]QTE46514.1 hypothetical protein J3L19_14520 [Mucilaginibacter rubeus]QTE53111.1 hypothetical protein J3L21_14495 [Mucilaginibacter rubeus]QTE58198.1 hypothetical protein J3L23_06165 [Mucilaginibacter rubeus]
MKYSEWKTLSADERQNIGWHRHPHIRTATLFAIVFAITFIIVVLGISKNSTIHLNRKPTAKEAFTMAKLFVKEKLKQPQKAIFPNNSFKSVIDTTTNSYEVQSTVKIENDSGKMEQSAWEVKMLYTDGDWAEKNSWQVKKIDIVPQP